MSLNLRNHSFLRELDFTPDELRFLLQLSAELQAAKHGGYGEPSTPGKERRAGLRGDLGPQQA